MSILDKLTAMNGPWLVQRHRYNHFIPSFSLIFYSSFLFFCSEIGHLLFAIWVLSVECWKLKVKSKLCSDCCSIIRNIMFEYHDIHNSYRLSKSLWCTSQHQKLCLHVNHSYIWKRIVRWFYGEKHKQKVSQQIIAFEWMSIETVTFK